MNSTVVVSVAKHAFRFTAIKYLRVVGFWPLKFYYCSFGDGFSGREARLPRFLV